MYRCVEKLATVCFYSSVVRQASVDVLHWNVHTWLILLEQTAV
jgi:hypothetical protein